MILHEQDPMLSALIEGIVTGILATIRELKLGNEKEIVTQVLKNQQELSLSDIEYWVNWFGLKD